MFVLEPSEVESAARRAAGWLRSMGVRAGDRVAVLARTVPALVHFTTGALRTGIVPAMINPHLPGAERDRIVADCEPALVVDSFDVDSAPADIADVPLSRPMQYTSGTTGRSKGVWSGVWSESDAQAYAQDEADLWGAEPGDSIVVCSPLYHSAPHRICVSALLAGARVVVFESFEADAVRGALLEATGAFLVPTHLRRLLPFEMPRARRVLHAGEHCPVPLKRRALESVPELWEFYGSTEGQFTVCSPEDWRLHPGSVGRARRGRTLSIADPGPDGVGTVWVTAPPFARWEYWNDAERTRQAWDGDTFTVGDLGRLHDAPGRDGGFLTLVGRRDDLIISGGVNVYPAEVERVLLDHPGVVEAAVYGVDDEEWGQRVCAAVVGDAQPDALRAWAREHLTPAQTPKAIRLVDALPRTPSGKVIRTRL